MIYREFTPSPALRRIVDRLWVLEGAADEIGAEPIPPDGHTEIIVHAADPFLEVAADGSARVQSRILLAGQMTRAAQVRPRGYARMAGARLRPDGARALLAVPQHELTNQIIDLSQIDRTLTRRLEDEVTAQGTAEGMTAALDSVLCRAAVRDVPASPAAAAVHVALTRRGLTRVDDLAAEAGVGARQLERLFLDRVGLRPKQFLRIVRFQQVLGAIREGSRGGGWAAVAAEHGFYDQSHFIRDFKEFLGTAPGQWQVTQQSLAAIFSAIRRGR